MVTLGRPLQSQILLNIQEALTGYFDTVLEQEEWQILIQGAHQLFKTLDGERLHLILVLLLQTFRSSPRTSSLVFVRDICQQLNAHEFIAFWPFLVNELLLEGKQKEPEVFQELCTVAGSLSEQGMQAATPCLKRLDALTERKIAADIFLSHPPALSFLFRILLESSQAAYFCQKLIDGLREQPLGWLDRAVRPLLDSRSEADQQFIIKLFQQDNPANPSPDLKKEGAAIIVERLPELSLEQRKEQWIAESISALSRIPLLTAYSLLVEIARDKQFLLLAKWPKPARLAALKALEKY